MRRAHWVCLRAVNSTIWKRPITIIYATQSITEEHSSPSSSTTDCPSGRGSFPVLQTAHCHKLHTSVCGSLLPTTAPTGYATLHVSETSTALTGYATLHVSENFHSPDWVCYTSLKTLNHGPNWVCYTSLKTVSWQVSIAAQMAVGLKAHRQLKLYQATFLLQMLSVYASTNKTKIIWTEMALILHPEQTHLTQALCTKIKLMPALQSIMACSKPLFWIKHNAQTSAHLWNDSI